MSPSHLEEFEPLGPAARRMLIEACERMSLSARGFVRVRRVARTLADLEGGDAIAAHHVAEAVQYGRAQVLEGG